MLLKNYLCIILILFAFISSTKADTYTFNAGCNIPHGNIVTNDGSYIYVGGKDELGNGIVNKISLEDYSVVNTIDVGFSGPIDIALTPDGDYLYVTNTVNGYYTTKIDVSGDSIITEIPGGTDPANLAFNSSGSIVYITSLWTSSIQKVSVDGDSTIGWIPGLGTGCFGIELTSDDQYAYVGGRYVGPNPGDTLIYKVSLTTDEIVTTIPISSHRLRVTSNGEEIWTTGYTSPYVYIVSAVNDQIIDSIYAGLRPYDIEITTDGQYAFVSNRDEDSVSQISIADRCIVKKYPVGDYPTYVSISPQNHCVYISNFSSNTITEINYVANNTLQVGTLDCLNSLNQDGQAIVPVYLENTDSIGALDIILSCDFSLNPVDIIYDECRSSYFDYKDFDINVVDEYIRIKLIADVSGSGPAPLAPVDEFSADSAIAFIVFEPGCALDTAEIVFDTTCVEADKAQFCTVLTDEIGYDIFPEIVFNTMSFEKYVPGDANGSCATNISDAVYIINYVFVSGTEPFYYGYAGDANGDCDVNVSDAVWIINYVFNNGPEPRPYCYNTLNYCTEYEDGAFLKGFKPQAELFISKDGNSVSYDMAAPGNVQGVQFEFRPVGEVRDVVFSANAPGLQMFEGYVDGLYKVGLLDMNGQAVLGPDVENLISVAFNGNGRLDLEEAILTGDDGVQYDVSMSLNKSVPDKFSLDQNYPNPFNPETEISYSIPSGSHVTLEVYNITGQKVVTLIDGYQEAGRHTARWDSRDEQGDGVASGIYLYRLTAGEYTQTRKMTLMK